MILDQLDKGFKAFCLVNSTFFIYNPVMSNKTIIYTDGGCTGNPGPGGWAAVIINDSEQKELSGGSQETTNNRMELTAVIEALAYCIQKGITGETEIHTDSQYVKNGINSWIFNWKKNGWKTAAKKPVKNKDLWILLDQHNQQIDPEWFWVKGHSGDTYNELCDSLVELERLKFSS